MLAIRCAFRFIVGVLFGLAPSAAYLVYARVNGFSHSEEFLSRDYLIAGVGICFGALIGTAWAASLLMQRRR